MALACPASPPPTPGATSASMSSSSLCHAETAGHCSSTFLPRTGPTPFSSLDRPLSPCWKESLNRWTRWKDRLKRNLNYLLVALVMLGKD